MDIQAPEQSRKTRTAKVWAALRLREVDPNLTAVDIIRNGVAVVFRLAEMALVAGLFSYVASQAENPFATAVSWMLNAAFGLYIFSYTERMTIFKIRGDDHAAVKWLVSIGEILIGVVAVFGSYFGYHAVVSALEKGIGI